MVDWYVSDIDGHVYVSACDDCGDANIDLGKGSDGSGTQECPSCGKRYSFTLEVS